MGGIHICLYSPDTIVEYLIITYYASSIIF